MFTSKLVNIYYRHFLGLVYDPFFWANIEVKASHLPYVLYMATIFICLWHVESLCTTLAKFPSRQFYLSQFPYFNCMPRVYTICNCARSILVPWNIVIIWEMCKLTGYLYAVVTPRTEFHEACLCIEREIADVDFAIWFEYGRRVPFDVAVVVQQSFGHGRDDVFTIGTGTYFVNLISQVKVESGEAFKCRHSEQFFNYVNV